jgi:hypothetical protein
VILIHQCNRTLKYNVKYIVKYCSAAGICICFIQLCHFLDSSGERGGGVRETFSVEGVIQKRWMCIQKIYILTGALKSFTRGMCPIGHFVSYSPTAVFWFLSEHCPPWIGSGWHWSVWRGHCRTLWSVNESPEDSSHSELLVFGLCPSSSILETRKHSVSETGSVSILRWWKTPTLLSPLERANLNY